MMQVETIPNRLGETLLRGRHSGGLTVLLNPRPEFVRTFGVLATHFGSLDHFLPGDGGAPERVPDGVAHFLEHKLFEDEQGDVSLRFSSRGASCNAATEFTKTSYHFSCSELAEDNVETLVEFVTHPYFTAESVQKEQGIIEQEIRMYDDDPDWVVFFQLLQALYHEHPVRLNIAGSVESIRQITPELLYRCHRRFYHPANMVLAVAGGFAKEPMLRRIEQTLDRLHSEPGAAHERGVFQDAAGVARTRVEQRFAVSRPQAFLGFKDRVTDTSPEAGVWRELCTRLVLEILFSQSSRYHERLYAQDIIDDTFDASYSGERDFGFTILASETDDPERFQRAVLEVLQEAAEKGLDEEDFARIRNRYRGRYIRTFNSAEAVAGVLVNCHFRRLLPDDLLDLVLRVRREDLEARLREHLRPEESALSVLLPHQEAGAPT